MASLRDVVVDCVHGGTMATFWDAVLDTHHRRPVTDDDLAWLAEHGFDSPDDDPSIPLDPDEPDGIRLWFNTVPEPRTEKNRLHLDVNLRTADEVERILAAGATVVHEPFGAHGERWWVLADPEGHLFCAFPPTA